MDAFPSRRLPRVSSFGPFVQIRDGSRVALVGLGADAVKNMVKAFISARRFVADDGLDLYSAFVPLTARFVS
jgi:stage V sporulation protein SpoVS